MNVGSAANTAARSLVERGASAVALVGSHARGEAHQHSDIDLVAFGTGSPRLRIVEGAVISESWTSTSEIEEQLHDPAEVGLVVPGWRTAVALHDDGTIADTIRRAKNWTWRDLDDRPTHWIAEELPGHAEEVLRLTGHILGGSELTAAVMRNVLATRMATIIAVHHRLLYATENRLWDHVAQTMGRRWLERQRAALGLDASRVE